jgi:hypothetical protein
MCSRLQWDKHVMQNHWLDRQQQSLLLALTSSDREGQIAHTELARRFGIEAGLAQVALADMIAAGQMPLPIFDL